MKKVTKSNGPGRPSYVPVIPRGKFSFGDFCEANGVNKETGKGKNCTALTLRKFIARDASLRKNRQIMLTDELAEPNNKKGLGRKSFLYQRTAPVAVPKATVKSVAKSARSVKVDVTTANNDYEATKAALGIASPAPVETPAETPAPVAEVPAPVAA